jgi:hypothetical protein
MLAVSCRRTVISPAKNYYPSYYTQLRTEGTSIALLAVHMHDDLSKEELHCPCRCPFQLPLNLTPRCFQPSARPCMHADRTCIYPYGNNQLAAQCKRIASTKPQMAFFSARARAVAVVTLFLRVLTLGLLTASLVVIATTAKTQEYIDIYYQDLYTYRWVRVCSKIIYVNETR